MVDTFTMLGRGLTVFTIPAGRLLSGTVVVPELNTGTPFVVPLTFEQMPEDGLINLAWEVVPVFSFSGTTLSWSRSYENDYYQSSGFPAMNFLVGVM